MLFFFVCLAVLAAIGHHVSFLIVLLFRVFLAVIFLLPPSFVLDQFETLFHQFLGTQNEPRLKTIEPLVITHV